MHAASSVECRSPVATARCHPKLRPDKGRHSRFENSRHSTFTPTTNTSVQDLPNRNDATGGLGPPPPSAALKNQLLVQKRLGFRAAICSWAGV